MSVTIFRYQDGFAKPIVIGVDSSSGGNLAVSDGAHYYWTHGDGNIRRMSTAGGQIEIIAQGYGNPTDIAVDDVAVYWIDSVFIGGVYKLAK